jgi:hypothetical protein
LKFPANLVVAKQPIPDPKRTNSVSDIFCKICRLKLLLLKLNEKGLRKSLKKLGKGPNPICKKILQ